MTERPGTANHRRRQGVLIPDGATCDDHSSPIHEALRAHQNSSLTDASSMGARLNEDGVCSVRIRRVPEHDMRFQRRSVILAESSTRTEQKQPDVTPCGGDDSGTARSSSLPPSYRFESHEADLAVMSLVANGSNRSEPSEASGARHVPARPASRLDMHPTADDVRIVQSCPSTLGLKTPSPPPARKPTRPKHSGRTRAHSYEVCLTLVLIDNDQGCSKCEYCRLEYLLGQISAPTLLKVWSLEGPHGLGCRAQSLRDKSFDPIVSMALKDRFTNMIV